jgi:hypothetical protein
MNHGRPTQEHPKSTNPSHGNGSSSTTRAKSLNHEFVRLIVPWEVKFPGSPSHKFVVQGFVKGAPFDAPYDDKISASVTVELTGSATWTYGT